jgi:hydroxymethylpyrimidine/phosphomethylpyrimidine kinase
MQSFGARNVLIKGGHLFVKSIENEKRMPKIFYFAAKICTFTKPILSKPTQRTEQVVRWQRQLRQI